MKQFKVTGITALTLNPDYTFEDSWFIESEDSSNMEEKIKNTLRSNEILKGLTGIKEL